MFLSKYWAIICRRMPDKVYLKWQYWHIYHKKLNIEKPRTYAEKLSYLKTHKQNPLLSQLVDKYEVRSFVEEKIGEQYLIPLLGVYNTTDEIPWDSLPDKYVLKCNHDSASVILHTSNEEFDRVAAIKSLDKHMSRNMFWYSREYPYRYVVPRIVCEEFLDDNGKAPTDYKIMCFNGIPQYVVLDLDRFGDSKRDIYDLNWNKLDISTDHKQSDYVVEKPEKLNEMIELATVLAKGFCHVRVDFYYVNGKIYFGELTFFPWGGPIWFEPDEWNYTLGDLITI